MKISNEQNKRYRELIHLAILSIMDPKDREYNGSMLKPSTIIKKAVELEYFNVDVAMVIVDRYYGHDMMPRKHLPRKAKKKLDRARHLVNTYTIKPKLNGRNMTSICGLSYYYGNPSDINSIYLTYSDECDLLVPFPSNAHALMKILN